jgi:hypothetical protein
MNKKRTITISGFRGTERTIDKEAFIERWSSHAIELYAVLGHERTEQIRAEVKEKAGEKFERYWAKEQADLMNIKALKNR